MDMFIPLRNFFESAYSSTELRRLLRGVYGPPLVNALPNGASVSLADLADAAAEEVIRRGLVPELFDALATSRPSRAEAVRTLRETAGFGPSKRAPAQRARNARSDPDADSAALMFEAYIEEYRSARTRLERRSIDETIASIPRRPSTEQLQELVQASAGEIGTCMACAVALGSPLACEDDTEAATMLVELLKSSSARVRFRSARSIGRRTELGGITSPGALAITRSAVEHALLIESDSGVTRLLKEAAHALRAYSIE